MEKEKYIELMNKEIDGVITKDEEAELRDYLNNNPEAARYYDDLKNSVSLLREIPDKNPPAHLKKTIMNLINKNKYSEKNFTLDNVFTPFHRYLRPRFAFALVLGIVVGIIVYPFFFTTNHNITNDNLSGTIGLLDEISQVSSNDISESKIKGNIKLYNNRTIYWFDCVLNTREIFHFEITYDKTDFVFNNLVIPENSKISVERIDNKIYVSGRDKSHFKIYFNQIIATPSEFQINLSIHGNKSLTRLIKVE